MNSLPLFDAIPRLAGVMPAVKAAMRRAAGTEKGEGRKRLADKLNDIAIREQVCLTGGHVKGVSLDTLNKWLGPSDVTHFPSVLALLAFCQATNDYMPLRIVMQAVGHDLMGEDDKYYRDYGKAVIEEKNARKRKRQLEGRL